MSKTYHLVCYDCVEYIWIGQSGYSNSVRKEFYLYTASKFMNKLDEFLFQHFGREHHLQLLELNEVPDDFLRSHKWD